MKRKGKIVVVSCWSGGIDPRWTIVCDSTTKYAKRTHVHMYKLHMCIYIRAGCPSAGYSLLEMRPAFASTSDPSGSRRATNRVTARDSRPKSPLAAFLSFLPSYVLPARTATFLSFPFSYLLFYFLLRSPSLSLYLFFILSSFMVVIVFFLRSGRYNWRGYLIFRSLR